MEEFTLHLTNGQLSKLVWSQIVEKFDLVYVSSVASGVLKKDLAWIFLTCLVFMRYLQDVDSVTYSNQDTSIPRMNIYEVMELVPIDASDVKTGIKLEWKLVIVDLLLLLQLLELLLLIIKQISHLLFLLELQHVTFVL